jgi:hypothetical protein
VRISECSVVEYSGMKRVGWLAVRGLLHFSRCELLLLEVGTSAIGSYYQATTGEDTAD